MERKMFGPGGRFGSPKERVLKIFRVIRGSETPDLGVSSHADANEDQGQPNTYNPQAYKAVDQRMHEVEAMKAMVISESRHDRWKAGGPL